MQYRCSGLAPRPHSYRYAGHAFSTTPPLKASLKLANVHRCARIVAHNKNASGSSDDAKSSEPSSTDAAAPAAATAATTTAEAAASSSGDAAAPSPSQTQSPKEKSPSLFGSLVNVVQSLPTLVQRRHLAQLKEQCEEEPGSAEKHAAYLTALNKAGQHSEVMKRVEVKEFGTGSPVIVEYLRALVSSGKVSDFASTSAVPDASQDHRSLSQLLREMQEQVAVEQSDDRPGASQRRPLHISFKGMPLTGPPRMLGVWKVVWNLLQVTSVVFALALFWLVGTYTVARTKLSAKQATTTTTIPVAAPTTSSAANPAVSSDPKEYKKDEISEKSTRMFKDVKGCEEAKEELREVVEFLKDPKKFTRLGAKLPKGVLLTGPPGTGKTLLARAVAGEAGVPFFYRAGSEFEELYVGVGSRRMRALFAAAKKKAPCIVFIDEIDSIGGNRNEFQNHSKKTLNQLLTEMDGFEGNEGVIVIAATNLPESLDPALKRPGRFDRKVEVPLPDVQGRTEILDYYFIGKPIAEGVNSNLIARSTQGFSGADLSNLVNEAAIIAAKANADSITGPMIDSAFDKIAMGVERKSVRLSAESRRHTAYHESGHAIVAMKSKGANPIRKATIMPRGGALGMVSWVGREDEFSLNYEQMIAHIQVCMGGTVAEEIIFGRDHVGSGATNDLKQATQMARYMVTKCGMSEAIGPVCAAEDMSQDFKERVDKEVLRILKEARAAAFEMLTKNEQDLHALAKALIEHETLTLTDIEAVLATRFQNPSPPAPSGPGGEEGTGVDKREEEEVEEGTPEVEVEKEEEEEEEVEVEEEGTPADKTKDEVAVESVVPEQGTWAGKKEDGVAVVLESLVPKQAADAQPVLEAEVDQPGSGSGVDGTGPKD